jgi:hypothetical protein
MQIGDGGPPRRPASEDHLPFERHPATRWFNPGVLLSTQLRMAFSALFGTFLDKRELQGSLGDTPITDFARDAEVWIDYLADTGDGFEPTYTMAWLLAQPALQPRGVPEPLPRGRLLVLGGDEVYPVATPQAYEDRFAGPFRAALPWSRAQAPTLLALPGNHDWYDGLTSFMRIFAQERYVGGWRTRQHRSYFAVQLPLRWWLWGVDTQLDSYLDAPQLAYFEALDVQPGDRIILCTARPGWVHAESDPEGFANHAYVQRRLIEARGAELAVSLSGDYHHYARYEDTHGSHKVTAGGGGAFTHPTHSLPRAVTIRVAPDSLGDREAEAVRFTLAACYPSASESRRLLRRVVLLLLRNPWFMTVPAVLSGLLLWTTQFGVQAAGRRAAVAVPESPTPASIAVSLGTPTAVVLLLLLLLAVLIGFAKPPRLLATRPRARRAAKAALGAGHWVAQVGAIVATVWLALRLLPAAPDSPWGVVASVVVGAALGGVLGSLVVGLYLWVCCRVPLLRTHDNEAFAALRHPGHKNFVRLHLAQDGGLTIYPIGVDRVARWRLDTTTTDRAAPWFAPDGEEPRPRLIEGPVTVRARAVAERLE